MPMFFFHLRSRDGLSRDEIGLEMPDAERAYVEACRTIPGVAGDLLRERRDPMDYAFVIADADGREVMEVPFDEMVKPHRPSIGKAHLLAEIERSQRLVAELERLSAAVQAKLDASFAALRNDETFSS